jgi:uncharacterized Zn finger protein (UPF0148 family)
MPLLNADGSLYCPSAPKTNKKDDEWKEYKQKTREEKEQIRNERDKEQFNYYIKLSEKYNSKSWEYIKMKLDEEKEKEKRLREQQKKEAEKENARFSMFSLTKAERDGYRIGGIRDKW